MKSQSHTPRISVHSTPASLLQKKLALGFVLAATFSTAANAVTDSWIGTAGSTANWATPANWSAGALPSATDAVTFSLSGTQTITMGASQTIGSLAFTTANSPYTLGSAADVSAGYVLTLTNISRTSTAGGQHTINVNVALANNAYWDIASGYNSSLQINGAISGAGYSLTKANNGTLILAGANTYSGGTIVRQGTLNLLFSQSTAPLNDILANGSTLTMLGGSVSMTGKAGSQNSQTLGTLNLSSGASSFSLAAGNSSSSVLLNLGNISRSAGATVAFNQPTLNTTVGATNGYTTSTANNASGILGAWATISGTTWAANNGTNIVAYTGYSDLSGATPSLSDGATSNIRITNGSTGDVGQGTGTTTVNTILVNDTTARTITIGTGNTLRLGASGGILTPSGAGALTIGAAGNAGTLTAGGADNTAGELIFTNAAAATVNAVVADNGTGAVALTKSGGGQLTLTAANTYSGGTYVNSGTLMLGSGATLNSAGNITAAGGILNLGGNTQAVSGNVSVIGGTITGGTITKSGAAYDAQWGTMAGVFGGAVGLTKTTAGSVTLSGTGTYTGDTNILEGSFTVSGKLASTVYVGSANGTTSASFTATSTANMSTKDVTVYSNGTASINNNVHVGSVTINGGTFYSSYGYLDGIITMTGGVLSGGLYGAHTNFTIKACDTTALISAINNMNTTSNTYSVADGAAAIDLDVTGSINGASGIIKTGAGLMSLDAANGYTGVTSVSAGTLRIGNGTSGSIASSGTIAVSSGAVVAFNQADGTSYTGKIVNSGTVTAIASGSNTLSGIISGGGSVVQSGLGTTILSGNNTYSGGTVVNSGSLVLGLGTALGSGTATVSGGALDLGGYSITNILGPVTGGSVNNGTVTNNGANYDLRSGSISANLAGSNGLTKTTSQTMFLTGVNTYTGATAINEGILALGPGGALNGTPTITIASGATFDVSNAGDYSYAGVLSGNGAVTGAVTTTGTISGALTFHGDVTVAAQAKAEASAFEGNVTDNGTITNGFTLNSGKTLSGSGSVTGDVAVTSGTVNGTNLSVSGVTSFTGASTLAGSMTSSGGISVGSNGHLNVTGHTTSNVTVNNAILNGTGSTGNVTLVTGTLNGTLSTGDIKGTGLVSPGNSHGILTATSVTSSVATGLLEFAFELSDTAPLYNGAADSVNDILHITNNGGLTLEAGTSISVYFDSLSSVSKFDGGFFVDGMTSAALQSAIANATFTFYVRDDSGTFLLDGSNYALLDASRISVSAINVADAAFETGSVSGAELEFTVVPEPSTWAMIASGFGLLAFGQRMRRVSRSLRS